MRDGQQSKVPEDEGGVEFRTKEQGRRRGSADILTGGIKKMTSFGCR